MSSRSGGDKAGRARAPYQNRLSLGRKAEPTARRCTLGARRHKACGHRARRVEGVPNAARAQWAEARRREPRLGLGLVLSYLTARPELGSPRLVRLHARNGDNAPSTCARVVQQRPPSMEPEGGGQPKRGRALCPCALEWLVMSRAGGLFDAPWIGNSAFREGAAKPGICDESRRRPMTRRGCQCCAIGETRGGALARAVQGTVMPCACVYKRNMIHPLPEAAPKHGHLALQYTTVICPHFG